MKIKSSLIQTQRPVLAQVLQQSISILMLSATELNAAIEQELQANPLLEGEVQIVNPKTSFSEISKSLKHMSDVPYQADFSGEEETEDEIRIPQRDSLEGHLLSQLRIELTDPIERQIGELIVGNLNAEGYLAVPLGDIAESSRQPLPLVEKVLKKIQSFDPVGIASRNLEECLTIQLMASDSPVRFDAIKIVAGHLKDLCHKRYDFIAQKTGLSSLRVKEASQLIAKLDPKPARNFQTFEHTFYIQPDIFVIKNPEGGFRVELNRKEAPLIRINPKYQKMLESKTITPEEREFIQERLVNAINFIKSIQQRGETIVNIAQYIVEHQKEFFEGNTASMAPLTLKDIAEKLERNESTISRAIHHKYIDTPQGLFALKFFFSQAVNESNKELSSYNVKEEIKRLVDEEDKKNPLSDQDILDFFMTKGIKLARRTINKYRQELGIPPSHLRKTA